MTRRKDWGSHLSKEGRHQLQEGRNILKTYEDRGVFYLFACLYETGYPQIYCATEDDPGLPNVQITDVHHHTHWASNTWEFEILLSLWGAIVPACNYPESHPASLWTYLDGEGENPYRTDLRLISAVLLFSYTVPYVLKSCAEFIETHGIVDGIYRLSGVTSNIQRLR